MSEELSERIFSIVKKYANIDLTTINPDKDFGEQVSLDSIQYVSIITRLEEELGVELPISIMEIRTLNEFLSIIKNEFRQS